MDSKALWTRIRKASWARAPDSPMLGDGIDARTARPTKKISAFGGRGSDWGVDLGLIKMDIVTWCSAIIGASGGLGSGLNKVAAAQSYVTGRRQYAMSDEVADSGILEMSPKPTPGSLWSLVPV
jgi:hypothetical protein